MIKNMHQDIIFCKTGGCGAKLGAGLLSKILDKLPPSEDKNLITGFEAHEDAAVYKLTDELAVISTLDFFPPITEDPYTYGQIAAANALSDIYAMGGRPVTALNIVCFPESMDMNILGKIIQGGADKLREAGASLAGGHSINDDDIKYGLSVTGVINPNRVLKNNTPVPGDVLILTKPLGVGIINAAKRAEAASPESVSAAERQMIELNKYASEIFCKSNGVHACTDVTGFGFLGHLKEMLDGRAGAVINAENLPYIPEAYGYAADFLITGAGQKNRHFVGDCVKFTSDDYALEELLFDPQTSGGLLAAVSAPDAENLLSALCDAGCTAAAVGRITDGTKIIINGHL